MMMCCSRMREHRSSSLCYPSPSQFSTVVLICLPGRLSPYSRFMAPVLILFGRCMLGGVRPSLLWCAAGMSCSLRLATRLNGCAGLCGGLQACVCCCMFLVWCCCMARTCWAVSGTFTRLTWLIMSRPLGPEVTWIQEG